MTPAPRGPRPRAAAGGRRRTRRLHRRPATDRRRGAGPPVRRRRRGRRRRAFRSSRSPTAIAPACAEASRRRPTGGTRGSSFGDRAAAGLPLPSRVRTRSRRVHRRPSGGRPRSPTTIAAARSRADSPSRSRRPPSGGARTTRCRSRCDTPTRTAPCRRRSRSRRAGRSWRSPPRGTPCSPRGRAAHAAAAGVWETRADDTDVRRARAGATVDGGSAACRPARPRSGSPCPRTRAPRRGRRRSANPVDCGHDVELLGRRGRPPRHGSPTRSTDDTVVVPFPGREPGERRARWAPSRPPTAPRSACAAGALEWSVPRLAAPRAPTTSRTGRGDARGARTQLAADIDATGPLPPTPTSAARRSRASAGLPLARPRSRRDDDLADRAADLLVGGAGAVDRPAGLPRRATRGASSTTTRCAWSSGRPRRSDRRRATTTTSTTATSSPQRPRWPSYRPETVDALAPVLDALAADIAAGAEDEALPALRVFDPYRGHSWASGTVPLRRRQQPGVQLRSRRGVERARARGRAPAATTSSRERADWMLSAEARGPLAVARAGPRRPAGRVRARDRLAHVGRQARLRHLVQRGAVGDPRHPDPSRRPDLAATYLAGSPERVAANVAEAGGAGGVLAGRSAITC